MTEPAAQRRIYLDNAATSWPKPESVYRAVDEFQRAVGASYGRGSHPSALRTARLVDHARRGVLSLLEPGDPPAGPAGDVVFTASGTDSIVTVLRGVLGRGGGHVVATVCEHNAVLRTLRALEQGAGLEVTLVPCDAAGRVDPDQLAHAIRPDTRLVSILHASNVTGTVQPVAEVGRLCRERGLLLLIDAAQTLGRLPIDVTGIGADFVAAPAHKGLLAPLGLGVLWVRRGVADLLEPLRYGGAASHGDRVEGPTAPPDKFEAGSLNAPAIAGLAAAVDHLQAEGVEAISARVGRATTRLCEGLAGIAGVRLLGPANAAQRAGVGAITIDGYDPHEAAALLSSLAGVECRAGLHCAPLLHEALGTSRLGGAVRFSPGATTTDDEIDAALHAVARLASAAQ